MKANGTKRERGAYFTPGWVAELLADWAIRTPDDVVVDPAAGRGDLLIAAAKKLALLHRARPRAVYGIELHKRTHGALVGALAHHAPKPQFMLGDFFSRFSRLPRADVVLANPPYVRHQDISGRKLSLMNSALGNGARAVAGKASAWAYFLVLAPVLLKEQGRLAFVLPAEILISDYAAGILAYLAGCFRTVKLVYCDGAVFGHLSQQTVLCLAEDYDSSHRAGCTVEWARLDVEGHLRGPATPFLEGLAWRPLSTGATLQRLLAPRTSLAVEALLLSRRDIRPLGEIASIGIGYVTGDNRFYHFAESQRVEQMLPVRHLTPVVTRSRELSGTSFTAGDWKKLLEIDSACWLFTPLNSSDPRVRALIDQGRRAGVQRAYKCSARSPWWKVQRSEPAPAILTYMGSHPRIVRNAACVNVPNTLYELRSLSGVSAKELAVASLTSVFQLSAILNARVLGGGLRKLEPSDAMRVLVPVGHVGIAHARRIDALARQGKTDEAQRLADRALLVDSLGWLEEDVATVRQALLAARGAARTAHSAPVPPGAEPLPSVS